MAAGITEWRTQELLARLDERTTVIQNEVKELRGQVITKAEFQPVRMITFGLIGLLVTGVVGAMLALVINAPK